MWKVLLLLACVTGSAIVYCDDPYNDDCEETDSSFLGTSSPSSSSSSSSSSTSHTSSSSSSKDLTSSSSRSSPSSSLQSSSTNKLKQAKSQDTDDTKYTSDDDVSDSESVDVGGSAGDSADADSSDDSSPQGCDSPKEPTPTYKCGPNEVFSNCTNGGCDARYCSQAGKPVPCVKLNPKSCKKGCVCKPGYLRTAKGNCVPRNQCKEGCGNDPNSHPGCGVNCGRTCSTYKKKTVGCILICYDNGCDCNEGWVYDPNVKKCVKPKDCTPTCGRNEQFDPCTNGGCGHRNCSQIGKPQICIDRTPESCTKGCICVKGYLRAANGTCIPQNQCPASGCGGDINAKPGCGYHCGNTCSTYKGKHPVCPRIPCIRDGCECKDGYVFDTNLHKCVHPAECTPVCGLNERYTSCINGGCGHRNCSQIGKPILCIDPASGACRPGCLCADGYLRDSEGKCVPEKECPKNGCGGDPYAKPGCGVNCGKTCDTYKVKHPVCPKICRVDGCDCVDGYVYDKTVKKCVKPEDCTPKCNKPNEVYDICPAPCPPRRCDVDDRVIRCAAPPKPGDAACKPGCRCADGYARNATGTCVLRKHCEKPLKCNYEDNEVYESCPAPCPGDSCDVNPALVLCLRGPQYGDPQCKPACRCIDGYARNADNKCVPRDQCPPKTDDQCPGKNEFYDKCISGCSNQSCDSIGKVIHCPIQPAVCREGCRCKPGFYRDADNECVAASECPPRSDVCTGQNEYFDNCINGCSNQTCDSIGKIDRCPIQPLVCRTGCRCKPGYWRNASHVCIAESECPALPCPDGEIYNRCPTVPCYGDYCPLDRNTPQTCPTGIVCSPPRCTCGLLDKRDYKTKKCIRASSCPPFKCDGPHESYNSCPPSCPGEKCSNYIKGSKCPPYRIGIVVPCRPACRCDKGYYRNSNGTCVSAKQCGPVITTTNTTVIITTEKPTTCSGSNDGLDSLKAGVTIFNGKFLYDRMKAGKGQNIITSPYSVIAPLVQMLLYSSGETLKQLTTALNVSSKEQIRLAYPALTASFADQTSVNFSTAAIVYSDIKYPLSEDFKKDSRDVVRADAQELNFSKNTEAAKAINSWVESKTNNLIHDLIQPSDLSSLTRLVLVNAIYFKGQWHYAFNKNNTIKDADFFLSDGTTKKTKLMYQEGQFNYGEVPELNCKVLQMFYKGDNFSMVIVLPNEKDGVLPVAEKLQLQPNFDKVMGSVRRQKVKVYVPPFKIETTTDLSSILKQMGITNIFNEKNSGLSGMLKTPEKIYVSKAIQKAFIEVNEEGSEAAAANGFVVGVTSVSHPKPPKEIIFRCDQSFLYYIVCKDTVLFAGSVVDIK